MRKDYRINKIKIEVEILESKIKQFSEKKINSEQLLKSVDDFKHALWKLV
jgi:hypothetical protein